MSSESNSFHEGFFARIIRDALCPLPDVSGERQTLMLEQQLHSLVEHSESAAPVISPPNIHLQTPVQTPVQPADAIAPTSVGQPVALQDSPLPVFAARKSINAEKQSPTKGDQHSAAVPVSEPSAVQSAAKNATHFPRNTRALAALQPLKKIPLAITSRDPRAAKVPQDRPLAANLDHGNLSQAPVQDVIPPTPASDVRPAKVDPVTADSKHPILPVAPPVIAESAPVPAGHRLIERKASAPVLRIGAVTLRIIEVVPKQAVPKTGQPVNNVAFADPIASAESRHFLRTL